MATTHTHALAALDGTRLAALDGVVLLALDGSVTVGPARTRLGVGRPSGGSSAAIHPGDPVGTGSGTGLRVGRPSGQSSASLHPGDPSEA